MWVTRSGIMYKFKDQRRRLWSLIFLENTDNEVKYLWVCDFMGMNHSVLIPGH